jgi:hypothetical protein
MPSPAITGSLALPAYKLRRMVSLSPTWIAACDGTDKPVDAPDRVWLRDVIGEVARPYAVVSIGAVHGYTLAFGGEQNWLRPNGQLFVFLTVDTPQEYYSDRVSAEYHAASLFGGVIDDVAALSAVDDPASEDGSSHLMITNIQLQQFGENPEENWQSLGRFFYAGYSFDWGDGGTG